MAGLWPGSVRGAAEWCRLGSCGTPSACGSGPLRRGTGSERSWRPQTLALGRGGIGAVVRARAHLSVPEAAISGLWEPAP